MDDDVYKYRHGRLPHWRFAGAIYFVTFHTAGSKLDENDRAIVFDSVLFWHPERFELSGFVVMPDHVHLVCYPGEEEDRDELSAIIESVKKYSARRINERYNMSGQLWMQEFYDRMIRNDREYDKVMEYIWLNP